MSAPSEKSGAVDVVNDLPERYDTMLGRLFPGGRQLSGGQWQRLALGRLYFRPASVQIFDEPTAALDAIAEAAMIDRLREHGKDRITLLISHRFSTVRMADTIVVLHEGRLSRPGRITTCWQRAGSTPRSSTCRHADIRLQTSENKDVNSLTQVLQSSSLRLAIVIAHSRWPEGQHYFLQMHLSESRASGRPYRSENLSSAAAQPGRYSKLSWSTAFFMTLFHIGAVWALFQFTWAGLAVFCVTYYVSLSLGIGMAYHRLLTHRSYKTPKAVEYFLTICATLALEGGPLFWVATHRKHHQHSDTDLDPHTPQHGGFWSHMGWILFGDALHNDNVITAKYAPDLGRDAFHVWISKYHWIPLDDARLRAAGARGLELGAVGRVPEDHRRAARRRGS